MSKRLDKVKLVKGREWQRQDPLDNIGVSTYALLKDAIQEGKNELAKDLADYLYFWEIKFALDTGIDLNGGFPAYIMAYHGEESLFDVYWDAMVRNKGLTKWPPGPVKKRDMEPAEFALEDHVVRMIRLHRMGYNDGAGGMVIREYDDRYEFMWDPCYTGGRTRRGDPMTCMPPHTAPPFNFPVTKAPHPWTAGQIGLTGYCIHCHLIHELFDIEATGHLGQWVVGYPENPWGSCPYIAYKNVDWTPEVYYTRMGRKKPPVTTKEPPPKNPKLIREVHSDEFGDPRLVHTLPKLKKAIDAGDKKEAVRLVDVMNAERVIHEYPFPWIWTWPDVIIDKWGYDDFLHILRSICSRMEMPLAPDEPKPTKAQLPSVEERVRKGALWARGVRSGPDGSSVTIIDEPKRIVMELNPCGCTGKRLLPVEKVDPFIQEVNKELSGKIIRQLERPALTQPPMNCKSTTIAHSVGWSKVGVPHSCLRCNVHFEMAAVAKHGYLTTVVERPANNTDPNCRWFFYKDLDDVPEEYYTRIGAKKPTRSK